MDSREQLVETARELLWERGYASTSPRLIQAASGVGQGSMYHHFATKEALAGVAMRRNADELQTSTAALFAQVEDPVDAILAYLQRPRAALRGCRMGRMVQDPEVLASEAVLGPISETLVWYRRELEALLMDAQRRALIRADIDPAQVAATLVAVVQGAHVLAQADRSAATFEGCIAGAVAMVQMLRSS